MKSYLRKLYRVLFLMFFVLSVCQLTAQTAGSAVNGKKNKNPKNTSAMVDTLCHADSLQSVIDSLQPVIDRQQRLIDSLNQLIQNNLVQQQIQKQKEVALLTMNDSLRGVITDQYVYLVNFGTAMLFRSYNSRVEDVEVMLRNVPESLKRADREQMLADAKALVAASKVPSEDMRRRVYDLLRAVPDTLLDEKTYKDISDVLRNVEDNYPLYNPAEHALALIEALPKESIAGDNRYDLVRELLSVYKVSNNEIKETLRKIQNSEKNTDIFIRESWSVFENQLKNTDYYKKYYNRAWTIRYLNGVIDEAIQRLHKATNRVKLDDLIEKL